MSGVGRFPGGLALDALSGADPDWVEGFRRGWECWEQRPTDLPDLIEWRYIREEGYVHEMAMLAADDVTGWEPSKGLSSSIVVLDELNPDKGLGSVIRRQRVVIKGFKAGWNAHAGEAEEQ